MKKLFTITCAIALSALVAHGESITFGYCQENNQIIGIGQGIGKMQAAIEIPSSTAAGWEGNTLSKVKIGFGASSNRSITLFLTESLTGEPFYTQTATMQNEEGWNEVELTTPYQITGKPFFVGYYSMSRRQDDYPLGVDDALTTNTLGDNVAVGDAWEHIGNFMGNVMIQIVIDGNNLKPYDMALADMSLPANQKPVDTFNLSVNLYNTGLQTINTFNINCAIDGKWLGERTIDLGNSPLKPGESTPFQVSGLSYSGEGINLPVVFKVVSVNGEDLDNASITGYSTFLSQGYKKNFLVEEWTGTWCGNCPRGIVGMDYMTEKYSDKGFIGIAVHQGDPMEIESYEPFMAEYSPYGFPNCVINRSVVSQPTKISLPAKFSTMANDPSFANLGLVASYDPSSPGEIKVEANYRFWLPSSDPDLRLAFVVTENNVGPYDQMNYYAGGSMGAMDGWEKLGALVPTLFNHVARDINSVWGIEGSVENEVEPGVTYTYSTTLPTANISNVEECDIIVMLINGKNGEIENAEKISMTNPSGIGNVDFDGQYAVKSLMGGILVEGPAADVEVFAIDGQKAGKGHAYERIELPHGVYVVRVATLDGNCFSRKVVVK